MITNPSDGGCGTGLVGSKLSSYASKRYSNVGTGKNCSGSGAGGGQLTPESDIGLAVAGEMRPNPVFMSHGGGAWFKGEFGAEPPPLEAGLLW